MPVAQQDPGLRTRERDELLDAEQRRQAIGAAALARSGGGNANAGDASAARSSAVAGAFCATSSEIHCGSQVCPARNAWNRSQLDSPFGRRAARGGGLQPVESVLGDRGGRSREAEIAIVRGGCVGAVQRDPARQREQRQREQGAGRDRERAGHPARIGGTDPRP